MGRRALPDEDKRTEEVKVRFSQRELEQCRQIENEYGITRAEVLRDLYMTKVRTLLARRYSNRSTAA